MRKTVFKVRESASFTLATCLVSKAAVSDWALQWDNNLQMNKALKPKHQEKLIAQTDSTCLCLKRVHGQTDYNQKTKVQGTLTQQALVNSTIMEHKARDCTNDHNTGVN